MLSQWLHVKIEGYYFLLDVNKGGRGGGGDGDGDGSGGGG